MKENPMSKPKAHYDKKPFAELADDEVGYGYMYDFTNGFGPPLWVTFRKTGATTAQVVAECYVPREGETFELAPKRVVHFSKAEPGMFNATALMRIAVEFDMNGEYDDHGHRPRREKNTMVCGSMLADYARAAAKRSKIDVSALTDDDILDIAKGFDSEQGEEDRALCGRELARFAFAVLTHPQARKETP
jgi:hypothetical protein